MDLHFLCPYHEHLVLRDKPRAEELWHGLIVHGKLELDRQQWARAASFFGSAAEIALLRASVEQDQQQIGSIDKLLYASKFLIDAFCHIRDMDSAVAYTKQLWANGQKLFNRQPWSKNLSLQNTGVKQRFAKVIEKCDETIELAKNNLTAQTSFEPKASNTRQRPFSISNSSTNTIEWKLPMVNHMH